MLSEAISRPIDPRALGRFAYLPALEYSACTGFRFELWHSRRTVRMLFLPKGNVQGQTSRAAWGVRGRLRMERRWLAPFASRSFEENFHRGSGVWGARENVPDQFPKRGPASTTRTRLPDGHEGLESWPSVPPFAAETSLQLLTLAGRRTTQRQQHVHGCAH